MLAQTLFAVQGSHAAGFQLLLLFLLTTPTLGHSCTISAALLALRALSTSSSSAGGIQDSLALEQVHTMAGR